MEIHANPRNIRSNRYPGMMTALNDKDGLLFCWESCKESFIHFYCGIGIMECKTRWGTTPRRDGVANLENPKFLISMGDPSESESVETRLDWLYEAMAMLGEELSSVVDVYRLGATPCAVICPDKIFIQNSVILHALMTIARSALTGIRYRAPHPSNNIEDFTSSVILNCRYTADAEQLSDAIDNSNLDGVINQTLAPFRRKGLTSWMASSSGGYPYQPGIVSYREDEMMCQDVDFKFLRDTCGLAQPAISPKEGYTSW